MAIKKNFFLVKIMNEKNKTFPYQYFFKKKRKWIKKRRVA